MRLAGILTLAVLAAGAASAGEPAATPIVFSTAAGIPDIAVRTGSVIIRVTRNGWYEGMPAWSPDRSRIAYVSARGGDLELELVDERRFVSGLVHLGYRIRT